MLYGMGISFSLPLSVQGYVPQLVPGPDDSTGTVLPSLLSTVSTWCTAPYGGRSRSWILAINQRHIFPRPTSKVLLGHWTPVHSMVNHCNDPRAWRTCPELLKTEKPV